VPFLISRNKTESSIQMCMFFMNGGQGTNSGLSYKVKTCVLLQVTQFSIRY
jgi:hypothetical protein